MSPIFSTIARNKRVSLSLVAAAALLYPVLAFAASADPVEILDLTGSNLGLIAIVIFVLAYGLIISEENIHLKKSKPAVVAAGLIWVLVALAYNQQDQGALAEQLVEHNLLEFVELFLFLLAAMTFINTMQERGVFDLLRAKLVSQGYSFRKIFWITGAIAFFM
ncbi:MAG: sodium:proton antiporter NhaD, partial [Pseudomonadales bacterium]